MNVCRMCRVELPADKIICPRCKTINITRASCEDDNELVFLDTVETEEIPRISTKLCDEIFGGGLALQSTNLISGEPGAGKSTLMLQMCDAIAKQIDTPILYIAAEETAMQIADRARRLKLKSSHRIGVCDVSSGEIDLERYVHSGEWGFIILDSIAAYCVGPGKDDRALQTCQFLKLYANDHMCPVVIIDHITKDDDFAGRKNLQHIVDATLMFYIDEETGNRVFKAKKNRFGTAPIEKMFTMQSKGLVPIPTVKKTKDK